jgi:hypothetical protein
MSYRAAGFIMSSLKQLKQAQKLAVQQQQVVGELDTLVRDIERCEKTIVELNTELQAVNVKHQGRKTTRDDIAYLNDLLRCANRKLAWEKQVASLQKRTPSVLERMANLMNDPTAPADEQTRAAILKGLQQVQAAMERLQSVKMD